MRPEGAPRANEIGLRIARTEGPVYPAKSRMPLRKSIRSRWGRSRYIGVESGLVPERIRVREDSLAVSRCGGVAVDPQRRVALRPNARLPVGDSSLRSFLRGGTLPPQTGANPC